MFEENSEHLGNSIVYIGGINIFRSVLADLRREVEGIEKGDSSGVSGRECVSM